MHLNVAAAAFTACMISDRGAATMGLPQLPLRFGRLAADDPAAADNPAAADDPAAFWATSGCQSMRDWPWVRPRAGEPPPSILTWRIWGLIIGSAAARVLPWAGLSPLGDPRCLFRKHLS